MNIYPPRLGVRPAGLRRGHAVSTAIATRYVKPADRTNVPNASTQLHMLHVGPCLDASSAGGFTIVGTMAE